MTEYENKENKINMGRNVTKDKQWLIFSVLFKVSKALSPEIFNFSDWN